MSFDLMAIMETHLTSKCIFTISKILLVNVEYMHSIWREVPEIVYKYLFDIVDSDEGTKDRVPNGLRGLQRRQRPCD